MYNEIIEELELIVNDENRVGGYTAADLAKCTIELENKFHLTTTRCGYMYQQQMLEIISSKL